MTVTPEQVKETQLDLRHALNVAMRVDGLDAKVVALLHDSIEDEACEPDDLRDSDLPDEVVEAVLTLTRRRGERYATYITRIKHGGNDLAIYVKAADLEANLARLDEQHASLEGRYRKALQILAGVTPPSTLKAPEAR